MKKGKVGPLSTLEPVMIMGIPAIRVFGDIVPPGEETGRVIRRVADGIRALCEYSEEKADGEVRVWLEVHGYFNTPEILMPLADLLSNLPLYGMIWDIEHTYRELGSDPARFYREFGRLIRHTHIKDCYIKNGKAIPALPGEGSIPIGEYLDILENGGYPGYYSFEWEKRWQPELPDPGIAFQRYAALLCQE